MIDVNKPIREAFVSALDGTVNYDGVPVPAYHEDNPNESETLYIILNTQTEEDASPKTQFTTNGTILIDVVHLTDGVTYDVVDTVANGVMNILQPTPQGRGLVAAAGLQILSLRKLSSTPLTFKSDEGNVMRRAIRYDYTIVQLN